MRYFLGSFIHLLKLSAVRKVLETILFLAFGSFETLGSKLSHGTSSKFADVQKLISKASEKFYGLIGKTVNDREKDALKAKIKALEEIGRAHV